MRIVSLLASGTELVCALGAGDDLVGRSHECDTPAWVTRLPALSRPTFDVTGSSGAIDRLVRDKLRVGAPLYEVDEARLEALAPDVVITQTHCEVCAVTPGAGWTRKKAIVLQAGSLDGILDGFAEVATLIGRRTAGERLVAELRATIQRWRAAAAARPRVPVLCLEWIEPAFAMGNWGPELVALAGGDNLAGVAGAHSTTIEWDEIRRLDPPVIVVAPCGFGLARAEAAMPTLQARPGWNALRAVRNGCVYVADGNLYFNRSGPSVFETIELLAQMLHPGAIAPKHEGTAWQRWPARAG